MVAKKWVDADEANQQSRKMLAGLLASTSKIAALMTGAMIGVVTIAVMIGATTIVIGVGRMTDQLTTPSMPSNQRPSATMRMPIPRSFRVPA
jgi:hypothetical protein